MVQTLQIGQAAQCAWRQITYTRERRADGPQNNYALKKMDHLVGPVSRLVDPITQFYPETAWSR